MIRRHPAISKFGHHMTDDQIRTVAPSAFAVEAHESRSDRYAYIPTSNIIAAMRREGFSPTYAGQSKSRDESRREFTKHMIRFRPADALPAVGGLFPEIILVNSHDGTSAYQLFSGLFRLVCLNGLMTGTSYESLRVPHKGDVVSQVIEGSFTVIADSRRSIEAAGEMSRVRLNHEEQQLFARGAHLLRFEGSQVGAAIQPSQLLVPRRAEDRADDLWTTFNRVQESTIRGGVHGWTPSEPGRRPRRVTTRGVQAITQQTGLNRALWTLAEGMAALKEGRPLPLAA